MISANGVDQGDRSLTQAGVCRVAARPHRGAWSIAPPPAAMSILLVENLTKTYPGTPQDAAGRCGPRHVLHCRGGGVLRPARARTAPARARRSAASPRSCGPARDGSWWTASRWRTRPAGAKRRIAVVPQTRNLDRDLTVREVLTYHARYFGLAGRRARSARRSPARRAAAGRQGREQARSLSPGGMQQRRDDRARPDARPAGAAARRADDRPRPAGAPPAVGHRCASCTSAASPSS